MHKIIMKFDGSCTNNKRDGDLGIGVHAYYENNIDDNIFEIAQYAGIGTSNEAEYIALITGMKKLINMGLTANIKFIGDSELIIKQMRNEYRCNDFYLIKLNRQANQLLSKFTNYEFKHVKREFNKYADELSKRNVKKTLTDYYNYKF